MQCVACSNSQRQCNGTITYLSGLSILILETFFSKQLGDSTKGWGCGVSRSLLISVNLIDQELHMPGTGWGRNESVRLSPSRQPRRRCRPGASRSGPSGICSFLLPGRSAALAMKTLPRGLQPLHRAPSPNGEPRHGVGGGPPARQVRPPPPPIGQRCAAAWARGQ